MTCECGHDRRQHVGEGGACAWFDLGAEGTIPQVCPCFRYEEARQAAQDKRSRGGALSSYPPRKG